MIYHIYYALYKGLSEISRVIQIKNHSPYSHVSVVMPNLETVIEALGGGVAKNNWTEGHTPTTIIEFYRMLCTEQQHSDFYKWVEVRVGKEYDYRGVINLGTPFNMGHGSDSWFCSELLKAGCDKVGLYVLDMAPHLCSPRDIGMIPTSIKEFMFKRVVPGELPELDYNISPLSDV